MTDDVTIRVRVADMTRQGVESVRRGISGLGSAAGHAGGGLETLSASLLKVAKVGALAGSPQAIAGVVGALQQLAPAALILPGALLSGAAAMQTFKIATEGFGEAVTAADPKAFAEATKDMAPAAVESAKALRDLHPEVDKLKSSVQGAFFAGLAPMLREVGGSLLPILRTGMAGISEELNGIAKGALKAADSPFFRDDVTMILDNTKQALHGADNAAGDLLSAFVGLGGVGSKYLTHLGDAVGGVTDRLKHWVDEGIEDGSIEQMIDGALAGFSDLGAIIGTVGSAIGKIFGAISGDAMASPLAGLRNIVQVIADGLTSPAALNFFSTLGQIMSSINGIIVKLLETGFKILVPILEALAPVVLQVVDALSAALTPALDALSTAFLAIMPQLGAIIQQIGGLLVQAIELVAPLLPPLIQAFFDIVAALLPVIPPLLQVAANLLPLLADALQVVVWIISNVVVPIVQALGGYLRDLANVAVVVTGAIGQAWQWLKDALSAVFSWMSDSVRNVTDWFRDLGPNIKDAVGNLGRLLVNAGRDLLTGLWDGIQSSAGWLKGKVEAFFGDLVPDWARDALGIHSPSKVFAELGQYIPEGLALGISGGMAQVSIASAQMATAAIGPVAAPAAAIASAPAASPSSGSSNGLSVRLVADGSADSALVSLLHELVRKGQLQLVMAP